MLRDAEELPVPVLPLFLALYAHAGPTPARGLVVHLDAGTQKLLAPVTLELKTNTGKAFTLTLDDAGTQPDVVAGDNAWSAVGMVEGTSASVTLSAGGVTATGADLAFPASKEANLDLQLNGDRIVAAAATAPVSPTPSQPTSAGATPASPTRPTEPRPPTPPAEGASRRGDGAPRTARADQMSDAVLYIGFGAGALLLAGLGYAITSRVSGGSAAGTLPRGVQRAPERGYLGVGTPGLAPGLSQWLVGADDEAALLGFLSAQLARTRPVLVHAASPVDLGPVWGGPVFTCSFDKPGRLGDAVDGLLENHPGLVIVLVGAEGAELARWSRDLTDDLAVYALVRAPTESAGPVIGCTRAPGGWTLNSGADRVVVADPPGAPPAALDAAPGTGVPS